MEFAFFGKGPTMNNSPGSSTSARAEVQPRKTDAVSHGNSGNASLTPITSAHAVMSEVPAETRRMQPLQFACGVLVTTAGMGLILLIGIKTLEVSQIAGDFALGLVAVGILTGVTLLGGGFGLMATASGGFDEREFDQLIEAGNISAVAPNEFPSAASQDAQPKSAA
jgi:hypothetical protein